MDAPANDERPTDDAAAQPLPAWMRCADCGYELAGLPGGGVCPECGLEVPTSWPQWELRRCDRAYVERLHGGIGHLRDAMVAIVLAVLSGVAATALANSTLPGEDKLVYAVVAIAAALACAIASGIKLAMLTRLLRLEVGIRDAPGAAKHHVLARDASMANWLLAGTLLVGGMVLITFFYLGVLVGVVGVLAWLAGSARLFVTGAGFLRDTIERAGGGRSRVVTSYAIELLPYAALGCIILPGLGVVPWWWLAAAVLVALPLAAGHLARRGARARRLLKGLIDDPA